MDWQFKRDPTIAPNSPVTLSNGSWNIKGRKKLWRSLGGRLFDATLDSFRHCVSTVLMEDDPQFDLPVNDRLTWLACMERYYHIHPCFGKEWLKVSRF